MAVRELPLRAFTALRRDVRPSVHTLRPSLRRNASADAAQDLESTSSVAVPPPSADIAKSFNPVAQAKSRSARLPASRYQFKSPKYYRGPLHPHQPPPESDPSSRLFQPGPFTLPRLEQTYQSTIAPDLLALTYVHMPPGYSTPAKGQRLREWTGESPYYKNRPLRPPRGGGSLPLLSPPRTFRNIPKITKVTVHSMASQAMESSSYLHVAGMVVQAITNVRVTPHKARHNVMAWGLRSGKHVAVSASVEREDTYHFLGKLINIVLPRIKEWKGLKGSSGDSAGNISFGLPPEAVAMFPEVEINYDMYPPKMIPGCHITIHTSATNDRDARLLLQSIGLPFYGKLIN